uniref:kelch-like protein 2 n=1 Tax=Ciona intestinalis TaxID=7719 RepID=UPI000180B6CC|nr:kelch-like protein 2 [Ciona intestinalis]|eukprot:XP_018669466.2 kelch-like protein 2 [Ciona intestinalis]
MAMVGTFSINGTCKVKEQTHSTDHSSDLLQFANKSRQDGRFIDIIIVVGRKKIPASKMVLSCHSGYFDTMFETEMEEKHRDVVKLRGVDAKSLEKLVDFMYTGKIKINTNNVCRLLAVSDFLHMHSIRNICIEYLLTTVSPQNCFTIQALAECYTIPQLTEKSNKFVVENYQQLVSSDQFRRLSKDDVIRLLQSTYDAVSPDLVYTAVMNWVKFDSNESYLNEVIKFVDFHTMSPEMLEDVVSVEPLVRKLPVSDCSFHDALIELVKKTGQSRVPVQDNGLGTRDLPVLEEKSLISLGGKNTLTKVTKFDLETEQWSQLPDLPVGRDDAAAVVIDDVLYYTAGNLKTDGEDTATNIVHRMKLKEKVLKWEKVASTRVKRWGFGAAVFNGIIFVFGGGDGNNKRLSSGESYVVSLNKWIRIKPMRIARSTHSVVAYNGHLYSLGGKKLCSVERYDPSLNEWEDVAPMQTPRSSFVAVVLNNTIYAIGGYDGNQRLKSVEKYNVEDDTWVYVASMNFERYVHAACVAQNKIYVLGGVDSNDTFVKLIECYDDQTDKWSVVGETEAELCCHSMVAV